MKLRTAITAALSLGLLLGSGCNPPDPNDEIKGSPMDPSLQKSTGAYPSDYPGAATGSETVASEADDQPIEATTPAPTPEEATPAEPTPVAEEPKPEEMPAEAPAAEEPASPAEEEPTADEPVPPAEDPKPEDETPAAIDLSTITLSEEEIANVNKLPEEDRATALAQKICPVMSTNLSEPHNLGSMDTPIKVELSEGRAAFVCCAGCVDSLKENPDKYLAILGDAAPQPKQD